MSSCEGRIVRSTGSSNRAEQEVSSYNICKVHIYWSSVKIEDKSR